MSILKTYSQYFRFFENPFVKLIISRPLTSEGSEWYSGGSTTGSKGLIGAIPFSTAAAALEAIHASSKAKSHPLQKYARGSGKFLSNQVATALNELRRNDTIFSS